MAALRGLSKSFQEIIICHSNPNNSASQLFFSRGIASKLFIKGLSFTSTEKSLAETFSKFGEVVEAKIIRDRISNKSKGFGYVTFTMEDEAQKALMEMNGKVVNGRPVFVDNVRPKSGGIPRK
ncbi:hypothetical protein JCGZ_13563 [Jatropha curcas]|uniref:RRM domain-containing protein n=1 Tax=Jatropha curcas TaxID=180498 RepID=A0A067KA53_JATCU|nr:hypothetical protein JCGZ_13563 [Jatropha curcas]